MIDLLLLYGFSYGFFVLLCFLAYTFDTEYSYPFKKACWAALNAPWVILLGVVTAFKVYDHTGWVRWWLMRYKYF